MSIDWSKYGVEKKKDEIDYSQYHGEAKANVIDWSKYERDSSINDSGGVGEDFYGPTYTAPPPPEPIQGPPAPTQAQRRSQMPSRQIPVLGPVLKTLDKFADSKVQNFIGDVGETLYTPGAGLANTIGLASAAGSAVTKAFPKLANTFGGRAAQTAIQGAVTEAPITAGNALSQGETDLGEVAKQGAIGGVMGGVLGGTAPYVGKSLSKSFDAIFKKAKPIIEETPVTQPVLGLPEPRSAILSREAQNRSALPPNTDVIHGQGNVETLGLPEGQYTPPTRLKVNNPTESLDYVMTKIKPEVMNIIEAPARRDLLVNYIQKNTGYEMKDIINRPMKELQELGQVVQQDLHGNMHQIAFDVAKRQGHDLPALLEGQAPTLRAQLAKDTQSQVYGVPAPKANIQRPQFNVTHNADSAMPETKFKRLSDLRKETVSPNVTVNPEPKVTRLSDMRQQASAAVPDAPIKGQALKDMKTGDQVKFDKTVLNSENTPPELLKALEERQTLGARTSDVLNRQEAKKLIEKHGVEGLYTKLMGKTQKFDSFETTAAEVLAKHFGSKGGEENVTKGLDLIAKTGKGSREMGQALQALTLWNKLDQSGALLLGTRQLNKGVNISEYKTLTPAQAAPIQEAAQRAELAVQTKSLADEVLAIVTNKAQGEALTEAEKATVKQFQDQVKLINEKGKGILAQPKANKADETIKVVSQIEPKARTRDQVINFLDAKAEKARQRLAKSRNVGILPDLNNPVFDYAIIGASKIANKVVKLSDFTEEMVRDFGDAIKPHINEVFTKATNIFRKENGLPTIEQLDRVVNKAVKNERFTTEEAKQFKAWASEIGHMSDEFKKEAAQDLQMIMKELGDSTLGEKIATVETGAMLLNAVTFERNLLGNATQFLQDKVSKLGSIPFDMALSRLTKDQRTIYLKPMNQEKFWQNWLIGTKSGWRGVSPTGMLESYDIHPNIFKKNNPFKYITKSLGATLQGFDYAFYSANKGDVLATYAEQLGKAQGLSRLQIKKGMKDLILQLDDRIHELADDAGKYATYQDDTLLSKGTEMLKQGLNYTTDLASKKLVDAGMNRKYSMEGYGAGTLVLKFAKTPANLIMRGLDFSPVGLIRAAYELAPLVLNKSKFNQHEASRALGRAITGTLGLTGMGYILADAGILSGSYSLDKDKRSIEEQSGQGSYKVNWSALGRFITSRFNYEEAKTKTGDRMMDYAWLQPMAISVSMGVNANKAVKEMSIGEATNGWKAAGEALLGSLATVLENPMVQGISNVVDASTDLIRNKKLDKFGGIVKGVPARFIPTLANQARTATDEKQRETFSKDLLTEMGNLMMNKVPGLSKKLPVSYDSLGNARERIQGGNENTVEQYLTAFFSPARMTEYQVTPEAKLVLDLMNQSGDQNVLPRIAAKYFNVKQGKNEKDLKVDLDAKQFSQLQQNLGTMVKAELAKQAHYLSNPNINLENKVKKVNEILTDVGKKARENIGTQMGYKKKDIKG